MFGINSGSDEQKADKHDNVQPMTTEEKFALLKSAQELYAKGGGHMYRIVQIISKSNPTFMEENDGDDFMIDFDTLQPVTLREVERYVMNCKRAEARRPPRGSF